MEDLAKQAKASRQNILDDIQKAHDEFLPLKNEVNELRSSVGVQPLEEPADLPCSVAKRYVVCHCKLLYTVPVPSRYVCTYW